VNAENTVKKYSIDFTIQIKPFAEQEKITVLFLPTVFTENVFISTKSKIFLIRRLKDNLLANNRAENFNLQGGLFMKDAFNVIGCLIAVPVIITIGYFIIGTLIYFIPFLLAVGVILLVLYLISCGIKSVIGNK
jgi:hypothetical protein